MFSMTVYTRHQFDTPQKAGEFFKFLNDIGGTFTPAYFDMQEPVKKRYTPDDLSEPIGLLSGQPEHDGGGLLLKGAKPKFLALVKWRRSEVASWHFYLSDDYFDNAKRREEFTRFVTQLCQAFSVLYGGGATQEDWDAKHWLKIQRPSGGYSRRKMGLEVDECLPGVYWLTLFGAPLVKHFGRKKLESLPTHQVLDFGDNGLGLILSETPSEPGLSERLQRDQEIISKLGSQYFFDMNNPQARCEAIPGVTHGKEGSAESTPPEPAKTTATEPPAEKGSKSILSLAEFKNQTVLSPDGDPVTKPAELAAQFVALMHMEVKEVFGQSRAALKALDKYFARHPQKEEYKPEHLLKEFIPALGGYLGEVLIKELGGKWQVKKPVLKSVVKLKGAEIAPFNIAYKVVFEDAKLSDALDDD
ncbi:MAG TPA: hypothetical protein VGE45_06545 [Chloroflexia bacterium]|jgi:hypothetical protein